MTMLVTFKRTMLGMGNPALVTNHASVEKWMAEGLILEAAPWPFPDNAPAAAAADPATPGWKQLTPAATKPARARRGGNGAAAYLTKEARKQTRTSE